MEWYLSTLRVSNADRIFNNFTIDVFGVNLFPKDRRIVLQLLLGPCDEGYIVNKNKDHMKSQLGVDVPLATSFSLKLARYQSAVCLIPVQKTMASSPT